MQFSTYSGNYSTLFDISDRRKRIVMELEEHNNADDKIQ